MAIAAGAKVMMSERGLMTVESVASNGDVTVRLDEETTYLVAADDVATALRAVATRADAEAALALVNDKPAPDTRSAGARAIAYVRLVESGSLADRMRALVAIQAMGKNR